MAMPAFRRAPERVLDLEFETRADEDLGFSRQVVLEQAVFAELSALARTTPAKGRGQLGFRPLDPAGRPS
jgi:hypothetical protein